MTKGKRSVYAHGMLSKGTFLFFLWDAATSKEERNYVIDGVSPHLHLHAVNFFIHRQSANNNSNEHSKVLLSGFLSLVFDIVNICLSFICCCCCCCCCCYCCCYYCFVVQWVGESECVSSGSGDRIEGNKHWS
ncbi:hypothetical protein F5H01DRAFT_329013 [Linnemannia elongata]|nr:hypothetical protein F5H01DRAFT_329013 [Linnemannia elongata]